MTQDEMEARDQMTYTDYQQRLMDQQDIPPQRPPMSAAKRQQIALYMARQMGESHGEEVRGICGPYLDSDPVPPWDYATMHQVAGEVTPEMEAAYRRGFNSIIVGEVA